MLALYCETFELYQRAKQEVDDHGVLVRGRTAKERVRNPALTPMNQFRQDLIRLAKAIPLVNPKPDQACIEIDSFLETIDCK